MTKDEVLAAALKLPPGEREALAIALFDSLTDEDSSELDDTWQREIARRIEEVGAGTAKTVSFDEYRAHVAARRAAGKP